MYFIIIICVNSLNNIIKVKMIHNYLLKCNPLKSEYVCRLFFLPFLIHMAVLRGVRHGLFNLSPGGTLYPLQIFILTCIQPTQATPQEELVQPGQNSIQLPVLIPTFNNVLIIKYLFLFYTVKNELLKRPTSIYFK